MFLPVVVAGNSLFRGNFAEESVPTLEAIDRQANVTASEKNLLRNILAYAVNLQECRFLLGVLLLTGTGKLAVGLDPQMFFNGQQNIDIGLAGEKCMTS